MIGKIIKWMILFLCWPISIPVWIILRMQKTKAAIHKKTPTSPNRAARPKGNDVGQFAVFEMSIDGSTGYEFEMNMKGLTDEVAGLILKKLSPSSMSDAQNKEFVEVDGEIAVFMFKDDQSQYANSVKVTLGTGEMIGWIRKGDSETAVAILEGLKANLGKSKRNKTAVAKVSVDVNGYWDEGDPCVESFTIFIASPVEARIITN